MTKVIAHRGASKAEPENTIPAFRRAVEMGADSIELDVRRSADDRLIVHHDAALHDGRVIRHTCAADLPEQIPELSAALDACAGAAVNIEIKNDPADPDFDPTEWLATRVSAVIARRGQPRRWLLSSFRREAVDRCRALQPAVPTAWLTTELTRDDIESVAAGGHEAVHPLVRGLDAATIRFAHAHGLAVNTWTCDDPDRLAELMAWGIDGVCTNVPDVALAVRAR